MMKLRYLLPLLFCVLSTFAGQALAYNCWFKNNYTITLPDVWTSNQAIGAIGGLTLPEPFTDVNPESSLLFSGMSDVITCPVEGTNNVVELFPPDASMVDATYTATYTSGETVGLLKTNVPGIVYTYVVRCTSNCLGGQQLYLNLPPQGKTTKSSASSAGYQGSEKNWDVFFTLYQTPEYRPHPGQTQVRAIGGTIGSMQMGTLYANKVTMNISSGSVLFTLAEPTCRSYGVNGDAYDRTVNFGDFYTSDFSSGDTTEKRTFTLDLFQCSMNKFSITVNGPSDASGNYLTNGASGTAEGIGVALAAQVNGNWHSVKFDGTEAFGVEFSGDADWYHDRYSIPFTGQLKKLGTVKAGTFENAATFTVSYE
ncbi:fimbrial protein [Citrobacter portucalensis]|uniref:Fimbrial protein n=1 Tax=Citrobacter portucalensis TaxID=1639133 RepID=A0AAJ1NFE2_9ENTR|nr:fimbrial protein [Citrobacter portucalensis]EHA3708508.1 fimbrial protein [Citrobacter freundii]MDE9624171.1 fimbrial protein [Citrobacter portucalensis]